MRTEAVTEAYAKRGLSKEGAGLTYPQVVQVYYEASGEVVGVVESVAEEGGHVESGQHGGGSHGHGPAAEDHQPHKHEVQKEELRHWPQVGQPVDGHCIDADIGTVLRQFSQDLQSTAFTGMWSQHQCLLLSEVVLKSSKA